MSGKEGYWANVWLRFRRTLLLLAVLAVLGAVALAFGQSQNWLHESGAVLLGIAAGLLVLLPLFLVGAYVRARRQ
jgi:dipeptide/tripeptide permease